MPNARSHTARDAVRQARRRGRAPADVAWDPAFGAPVGNDEVLGEPTTLHAQRLDTVAAALRAAAVRSVADLGCGDGALVRRLLADPAVERIVALDQDVARLGRLERSVGPADLRSGRLRLLHGSFAAAHQACVGVQAVTMVETIEHLAPAELSALEHQVFSVVRPALVLITTPNVEYNGLLGMAPGQRREPGHLFEWPRSRFRAWATGVARRRGYVVRMGGIGPEDASVGSPTQWARFQRMDEPGAALQVG